MWLLYTLALIMAGFGFWGLFLGILWTIHQAEQGTLVISARTLLLKVIKLCIRGFVESICWLQGLVFLVVTVFVSLSVTLIVTAVETLLFAGFVHALNWFDRAEARMWYETTEGRLKFLWICLIPALWTVFINLLRARS